VSKPTTPADVVRAVAAGACRLIAGKLTEEQKHAQLDELVSLYAEETYVRHPFAPMGDTPLRTRAELRAHFAKAPSLAPDVERFDAVGHVHETSDPEMVIFEFSYVGMASGRDFTVPCIFATRVRDGLIVESRDYADHVGLARVFGRLSNLGAVLAADPG
jgi:ketosteroid isomerase-like protein